MNFQERTKMDCEEMDFWEKWIVRKQILRKKNTNGFMEMDIK